MTRGTTKVSPRRERRKSRGGHLAIRRGRWRHLRRRRRAGDDVDVGGRHSSSDQRGSQCMHGGYAAPYPSRRSKHQRQRKRRRTRGRPLSLMHIRRPRMVSTLSCRAIIQVSLRDRCTDNEDIKRDRDKWLLWKETHHAAELGKDTIETMIY